MSHYTLEELEALKLYDSYVVTIHTIGSTKYRQVDYSPMLSGVFIKTFPEKRYRAIKDFFGQNAAIEAQRFCLDRVNN